MKPLVILDSNVFYGSRPLLIQKVRHLLALSSRDKIRLVVPEVVVLEIARQWSVNYQTSKKKLQTSLDSLQGLLGSIGSTPPALDAVVSDLQREEAFEGLRAQLVAAKVEVPHWPDISLEEIVERDLSERKPFAKGGKGFRDFLIWKTAVESISTHSLSGSVFLVSANTNDFAAPDNSSIHNDLLEDLVVTREITYLTKIDELMVASEIAALANVELWLHSAVDGLDVDQLVNNAQEKLDALSGSEVASTIGDYDYEFGWSQPLPTALESPSFVSFDLSHNPVITTFKTEKDDVTGIQVDFDAECQVDGYLNKSDYYINEYDEIDIVSSDWNSHMMLAEQTLQVRVTFSGEFTAQDKSSIDLQLEEIADRNLIEFENVADYSSDVREFEIVGPAGETLAAGEFTGPRPALAAEELESKAE